MNDELLALYNADREERVDQPRMGTPQSTALRERDKQRRLRAAAILSTLEAPEAVDLYHAALLFQHGDLVEDAWRAYERALIELALVLGIREPGKDLLDWTIDREICRELQHI